MYIALDKAEYYLQISAISGAAGSVKGTAEQPEMTGDMPSLKKYLESYRKISNLLEKYAVLLDSDASQMKGAAFTIAKIEENLLK